MKVFILGNIEIKHGESLIAVLASIDCMSLIICVLYQDYWILIITLKERIMNSLYHHNLYL